MTTTIGGVTVADPDIGWTVTNELIGEDTRSQDGTLLRDWTAKKRRWQLSWTYLTAGEFATIDGELTDVASQIFSPPYTASTFSVLVDYNSYTWNVIEDFVGDVHYNVTVTLIEA